MPKKPQKLSPSVLSKDTAYSFPHLLVLDASAGAGKTHALASRYVQFLLSSHIPQNDLPNLLAITFTKKAAEEMKVRVLDWLKEIALGLSPEKNAETLALVDISPGDLPKWAEKKVDEVIARYSDFHIQTIDSFLHTVLKASALELGLRPDPEVTLTYKPLLDYALSVLLKEVGSEQDTPARHAVDEYLKALNRATYRGIVWDPVQKFQDELEGLLSQEAKHLAPLVFQDRSLEIEQTLDEARKLYARVAGLGLEPRRNTKLGDYLKDGDVEGILSHSLALPFNKGKEPKLYQQALEQWENLSPLAARLALDLSYTKIAFYGTLFGQFKQSLKGAKDRLGTLHISDVNRCLAEYLIRDQVPEVYYRLGDRIDHFLVDEFQDTDPGQWQNIKPLLEEAFSKDGSFFAVGDLKQAIYMFRSADYRIMRDLIQDIAGQCTGWLPPSIRTSAKVLPLNVNFRSDGVILSYVKQTFQERLAALALRDFEDRSGLTSFKQEALPDRKDKGYVRVMVIKPPEDEEESLEPPEKSALKAILDDLRVRGYPLRDIAILAFRNATLETVVEWLTEWGLQATATSSLDIRKRKVIAELLMLLKFLDAPVDDLSFGGFITGEVFLKAAGDISPNLDRQSILDFIARTRALAGTAEYLFRAFREEQELEPLWAGLFQDLYRKVGYYPLYDLVTLALKTFQVAEHFPSETAAVLKFVEIISAWEDEGLNSIRKFLEKAGEDEEEAFSLALPEYLDAVQVLTFHKSKGLTFPVVINLLYGAGAGADNMTFSPRDGRVAVQYLTQDVIQHSPDLARIYEQAQNEALIQTLNTLYVVSTRARHELYQLVIPPAKRAGPEWLALFPDQEMGRRQAAEPAEVKERPKPLEVTINALEVPFNESPPRAWTVQRQEESLRGEFIHKVLAGVEYWNEPLEPMLTNLIARTQALSDREFDLPEVKQTLLELFALPGFREWFEEKPGRRVKREAEYVDEHGQLIRMDRVVINPDRVTAIDFKSGEGEIEEHKAQVRRYMSVLAPMHQPLPVQGFLAYLDTRKIVEVAS